MSCEILQTFRLRLCCFVLPAAVCVCVCACVCWQNNMMIPGVADFVFVISNCLILVEYFLNGFEGFGMILKVRGGSRRFEAAAAEPTPTNCLYRVK